MIGDILVSIIFAALHWVRSEAGSAELDMVEAEWHALHDQGGQLGETGPTGTPGPSGQPIQMSANQAYPGRRNKQSSTVGIQDQ